MRADTRNVDLSYWPASTWTACPQTGAAGPGPDPHSPHAQTKLTWLSARRGRDDCDQALPLADPRTHVRRTR